MSVLKQIFANKYLLTSGVNKIRTSSRQPVDLPENRKAFACFQEQTDCGQLNLPVNSSTNYIRGTILCSQCRWNSVKTDLPVDNSTKPVTCQGFKCRTVVLNLSKKYYWGLIEFRYCQKIDLGENWRQLQGNITVKCGFINLHSQEAVALNSKRGEDAGPDCNPVHSLRANVRCYLLKNWLETCNRPKI